MDDAGVAEYDKTDASFTGRYRQWRVMQHHLQIEAEEPFAPVPDETPQLDEAHAVTCPFCNAQFVPK